MACHHLKRATFTKFTMLMLLFLKEQMVYFWESDQMKCLLCAFTKQAPTTSVLKPTDLY